MLTKHITLEVERKHVLNANQPLHYHAKARRVKAIRTKMREQAEVFEEPIFNLFKVTVHVCPPTRHRLDPSNLFPSVKPALDALTDNNWWEDDDYKHLDELTFRYGGLSGIKGSFLLKFTIEEKEKEPKEEENKEIIKEASLKAASKKDKHDI